MACCEACWLHAILQHPLLRALLRALQAMLLLLLLPGCLVCAS
jgi:hypothetical protein